MESINGFYWIHLLLPQLHIVFMKRLDLEKSRKKICLFVTNIQIEILICIYWSFKIYHNANLQSQCNLYMYAAVYG